MIENEQKDYSYLDQFIWDSKTRDALFLPTKIRCRYLVNTCLARHDRLEAYIEKKGMADNCLFRPTIVFLFDREGIAHDEADIVSIFSKSLQHDLIMVDLCGSPLTGEELATYHELSIEADFSKETMSDFFESWGKKISLKKCKVYSFDDKEGILFDGISGAYDYILDYTEKKYSLAPEWQELPDELYGRGNSEEYFIQGLCRTDETPYEDYIKTISEYVHNIVDKEIKESGRISISMVMAELKKPPFGFLNNLCTVYVLGLAMRDYTDGRFFWSNELHYDVLDAEHLSNAVAKAMHRAYNYIPTYTEDYIILFDEHIGDFISAIKEIFDIKGEINSPETLRKELRHLLERLDAPLWAYKETLDDRGKQIVDEILNFVRGGDVFEIDDCFCVRNILSKPHKNISLPAAGSLMTPEWKWIWHEDAFCEI